MSSERRNKGPEHIRNIIKDARKEWQDANTRSVMQTSGFRELQDKCPGFLQMMFIYIEGDPQYIRIINLN
jgi:hypothetical protein